MELQINNFAMQGDSDSRKDAEQLLVTATKYSNYLSNQIESQKMSTADYKTKVDNFIKLDEANLAFFAKAGFKESLVFIQSRLQIMKAESAQLAALLAEQAA